MSDPSWRPDEDAATIHSEDTWLQGALVMCMAFGAVATLSIQCFFMLCRGFKRSKLPRDGPLFLFVVLILILSTIFTATTGQFTVQAFVDDRNFPGGPAVYEVAEFSIPLDAVANDCLVVSTFLCDALLLWRCTVIYRNSRVPDWLSMGLAAAFWLTEFLLGTFFLIQLSATSIWGTVNLTLGFWCFSLALNVIATILIVGRLLYYRFQLSSVLGKSHVSQYTGVIAMVVESELLYTAFLIMYIVPFVLNNSFVNAIIQAPSLFQSIAALMIVYRVADGKGWTRDTYADVISTRITGSTIQLSNLSTLRAAQTTTFASDAVKSVGTGVQITQEVYMSKESGSSVDERV